MFRQYLRQADHNLSFANKTLQYSSYKIYLVSKLEGGREWDFKFRTYSQNEQKSLLLSFTSSDPIFFATKENKNFWSSNFYLPCLLQPLIKTLVKL